jgi:hypothetical protein
MKETADEDLEVRKSSGSTQTLLWMVIRSEKMRSTREETTDGV